MGGRSLRAGSAEVNATIGTGRHRSGRSAAPRSGAGHEAGSSRASETWVASDAPALDRFKTEEDDDSTPRSTAPTPAAEHPAGGARPSDVAMTRTRPSSESTTVHAKRTEGSGAP